MWRTPTPTPLSFSHATEDYDDTDDDTEDYDEIDRPQFRIADFAQSKPVFSVYRALGIPPPLYRFTDRYPCAEGQ